MEKIKKVFRDLISPYLEIIKYISWEFSLFISLLMLFLTNTLVYLEKFYSDLGQLPQYILEDKSFILILIAIVLFFSLLANSYYWAIRKNKIKNKITIISFILLIQALILAGNIYQRYNSHNYYWSPHDGITQTEAASDFLTQGKNPYHENYYGTVLDNGRDHLLKMSAGNKKWTMINPALESYAYMPLHFILPIPINHVFVIIFNFYDGRILNFLFYLLSCFLIYKLPKNSKKKICLLIFFCLNPLFYQDLFFGYSDILPIYFLLLAYYFLTKERYSISIATITVAGLIKQNIIFIWPFFLTYIFLKNKNCLTKKYLIKFIKYPLIMLLIICSVLLPFILWCPSCFYHDTVYYLGNLYPARGIALAGLLVRSGIIKHPLDPYNFQLWQIIFILIFLPLFLYKQYKNNTTKNAYLHGILLMGGVWFLSRNFTGGHLDVLLTNLLIILFL